MPRLQPCRRQAIQGPQERRGMMAVKVKGRRTGSPPPGESWIWHTLELRRSKAWQGRSIGCTRLIEFLELEHLQHGANENGRLFAPYSQLEAFGISRRTINDAILEAESRGLIRVDRGGLKGRTLSESNRFTLTYAWTRVTRDGVWYWTEPTDNWEGYEGGFVRKLKPVKQVSIGATKDTGYPSAKAEISATKDTVSVPQRTLPSVPQRTPPISQVIDIATPDRVPQRTLPSISGQGTDNLQVSASRLQELSSILERKGRAGAPVGSAVARPPLPAPRSNPPNRPMVKQVGNHG